jgi:hypothetical protein
MHFEQKQIERAVVVLNAKLFGILIGFLSGSVLFLATNFLILKGGEHVGAHLALLSVFFPGYRVTVFGSIIGFFYMFLLGCIAGIVIGLVYNKIARTSAYNTGHLHGGRYGRSPERSHRISRDGPSIRRHWFRSAAFPPFWWVKDSDHVISAGLNIPACRMVSPLIRAPECRTVR